MRGGRVVEQVFFYRSDDDSPHRQSVWEITQRHKELPQPAQQTRLEARRIADLACRQLVVVERHGQAQITRFCANLAARANPDPECALSLKSAARIGSSRSVLTSVRSVCPVC
jgi:hypothetical protein